MIFVSGFYDLSRFEKRRTSTEEWAARSEWLFNQGVDLLFFAENSFAPHLSPATIGDPAIQFNSAELLRVDALLSRSKFEYDPTKDTARYLMLMRIRYTWMLRAARLFDAGETVFTWVDSGLPHSEDDTLSEVAQRDPAPGKIRMAAISYVPQYARHDLDVYYSRHWWPVGGGLWSARAPEIEWLAEKIAEEWERCLDLGFAVTDEMMLGRIVIEHPEKFDLYYADHTSLAANWRCVRRSQRLVAEMALRALEDGSPTEASCRFRALWYALPPEGNCRHCGKPWGTPGIGSCWHEPQCFHSKGV